MLPQKIGQMYNAFGQPFHIFLTSGDSCFAKVDGLAEEDEGTGVFLQLTDERGIPLKGPGIVLMENEIEKIVPIA